VLGFAVVAGDRGAAWQATPPPTQDVTVIRTPDNGLQPQVAVDAGAVVHLLYFKGEAAHGDLFYVRLLPQSGQFSPPLKVNTEPGSAVSTGSMRGGQLALGRDGRVHVAWQGSSKALSRASGQTPILYTRMNDTKTGFEPERNVVTVATGVDGSGIAAGAAGDVYVAWHANLSGGKGEGDRRLWVARSSDDGRTFAREIAASASTTGACGCCGVRVLADRRGTLHILFRSAADLMHRDTYLLTSRDKGTSFSSDLIQPWNIGACPMSTFSLSESGASVLAAWETGGQVQWLRIDGGTGRRSNWVVPPGSGVNRKYPAIAGNSRGDVMLAWVEGTSWNRGGSLVWQRFASDGTPVGASGRRQGVPAFSLVAVAAGLDDTFFIVY
jgi:hypothetical protein